MLFSLSRNPRVVTVLQMIADELALSVSGSPTGRLGYPVSWF
jgi:hypothetical protein